MANKTDTPAVKNENTFAEYNAADFRQAIFALGQEIDDLQRQRQELLKQRRTIETVMYMTFPKEAVRDGYMSATAAIAQRLRRAKESNEKNKFPVSGSPSHGALRAEHLAKQFIPSGPPQEIISRPISDDTREGLPIKTIPRPK